MKKLRKIVYATLSTIAIIVAVCSLLSIFRNTENRILKILDFPRIQFFIISIISLVFFLLLTKKWQWYSYLLVICLIGGIVVNGSYIINYTTFVSKPVPSANKKELESSSRISILLANVKMSNRNAQPFLDLIESKKPDLIIAMEIDD